MTHLFMASLQLFKHDSHRQSKIKTGARQGCNDTVPVILRICRVLLCSARGQSGLGKLLTCYV